jgi:hypothetical protein
MQEILHEAENTQTADGFNTTESQKHNAKWKKLDTKKNMLHNSIYTLFKQERNMP